MAQESWKREEEAGCQLPEGPVLCTNNCGFFGSGTTMNMCSKCYREHVMKQSKSPTAASPPSVSPSMKQFDLSLVEELPSKLPPSTEVVLPPVSILSAVAEVALSTPAPASAPPLAAAVVPPSPTTVGEALISSSPVGSPGDGSSQQHQRLPNRCFACRKRVGLTGFKCRCGDVFCSLHRYSDKHACSYDYKAAAREAIAKANPVVKAEKIEKI